MSGIELAAHAGPSNTRPTSEIIDVDALPDEVAAGPSNSRHRSQSVSLSSSHSINRSSLGRRQRVVYVLDSDDEELEPAPRRLSGV